tara:strand:- start:4626 stop:5588 length:963 start_codon:yes stop_codon:yes gene_type:complete
LSKSQQKKRTYQFTVKAEEAGTPLDRWCVIHFSGLTIKQARRELRIRNIRVDQRSIREFSRPVRQGERIAWTTFRPLVTPETPKQELHWDHVGGRPNLLFRDRHLAILDKPSDIPVEPTPKEDKRVCLRQLELLLKEEGVHAKKRYVTAAHRLDAGASGVVAFATSKSAASSLGRQFQERTAKRTYEVIVVGSVEKDKDILRDYMGSVGKGLQRGIVSSSRGKLAITHYEVLQRYKDVSHLRVQIETGRTHQIRVHMAHLGHPIVGDWLYCPKEKAAECPKAKRLFLHAKELTLVHPHTDEEMTFSSPLPAQMQAYLDAM